MVMPVYGILRAVIINGWNANELYISPCKLFVQSSARDELERNDTRLRHGEAYFTIGSGWFVTHKNTNSRSGVDLVLTFGGI